VSFYDRERYTDDNLELVIDSVDNPITVSFYF
jgi:hypothetical protein